MPKNAVMPEDLLSAVDAGKILGVSADMVRLLARDGRLPAAAQTTRGLRLFRRSQVEQLASERAGLARHDHAVQFYDKKEFLSDFLANFIAAALRARAPIVVIAREWHRKALCERNDEVGVDIRAACDSGQLAFYDAGQVLATFMVDGVPDPGLFRDRIGDIIGKACKAMAPRPRVRLRIYGEMVDLLWSNGHREAALRLEEMWNELAREHSFALQCAYDMGNFRRAAHQSQFEAICASHTHVTPAESYPVGAGSEERERHIALLQQRSRALQSEVEERTRQEDAMRGLSDFVGAIGQELRGPLAAIQGALEPVRGRTALVEQQNLDRQVGSLVRLADDLLEFSRLARGEIAIRRQRVDLADVIGRAVDATAPVIEERGLRLDIRVPAGLAVEADPDRMVQVVSHLLVRAARGSDPGSPIRIQAMAAAGSIRLAVKDEGVGIAPDRIERVFEPFLPGAGSPDSSPGHLSLGLAIARDLVELHGGTIAAHSDGAGTGSELVVTIPVAASAVVASRGKDSSGASRSPRHRRPQEGGIRRILVVDDNEDLATLIGELLQGRGHKVALAHDGGAALELATPFEPDIALLDIDLPGMDGYELARELRDLRQGAIRLIAITGYAGDADRRRSEEAGFSGHLVKPVDPEQLAKLIEGS